MTQRELGRRLINMPPSDRAQLLGVVLAAVVWDKDQAAIALAQLDDGQLPWLVELIATECKRRGLPA